MFIKRVRTDVPQSQSSTVRMLTSPYVSQSRFPHPYIPQFLYSPTPFFPNEASPMFPGLCVSQSLCFPVPMFSSPFIHQSRYSPQLVSRPYCSPKIFPSPYVPLDLLFPRPDFPQRCSPVPMSHISVSIPYAPLRYSPVQMFPGPFVPSPDAPLKCFQSLYVPQRCSPIPMIPNSFVPQSRCSPKVFPVPICSPKMFPNPYDPQFLCSPVPMFP